MLLSLFIAPILAMLYVRYAYTPKIKSSYNPIQPVVVCGEHFHWSYVMLPPRVLHAAMTHHVQECVYHKAVMDKKSPSVLARIAKQAGNLYSEASSMFNGPVLVQHFERSWVAHTQMKVGVKDSQHLLYLSMLTPTPSGVVVVSPVEACFSNAGIYAGSQALLWQACCYRRIQRRLSRPLACLLPHKAMHPQ